MEPKTYPPKQDNGGVYAIITNKIIELLEQGTVPWREPWNDGGLPRNLVSRRPYRGINLLLLSFQGYEQNFFLTYKQVTGLGGKVKRREHATMVIYWNYVDKKGKEGKVAGDGIVKTKVAILRYYFVFNVAQCEGIPSEYIPRIERDIQDIPDCAKMVECMPNRPAIRQREQRAYYHPLLDFVNMPKKESFESSESYYATPFHELVHSTGHRSRLNRRDLLQMSEHGVESYSHEELIAEIGASYLLSMAGITSQLEQSAAHIQGWLEVLKNIPISFSLHLPMRKKQLTTS